MTSEHDDIDAVAKPKMDCVDEESPQRPVVSTGRFKRVCAAVLSGGCSEANVSEQTTAAAIFTIITDGHPLHLIEEEFTFPEALYYNGDAHDGYDTILRISFGCVGGHESTIKSRSKVKGPQ